MMHASDYHREAATLQAIVPRLEADGFAVFLHPSRTLLPPFLDSWQLDAVAIKGEKKILIEIVSGSPSREKRLGRLREMLSGHPDWELRVIYAPPLAQDERLAPVPHKTIEAYLQRAVTAFDVIGPAATLLAAWSAFEAAARAALPSALSRPQPPANLIETLATDGYVTPDEAEILRRLASHRNAAAHGELEIPVTKDDIQRLADVTRIVLNHAG